MNEPKIYLYHGEHEHDRIYSENLIECFANRGILWRIIPLREDGLRPELQLCLDDRATAVLGYNAQLDHSWLHSGHFLAAAEQAGVPVIQWILDHPSRRWGEFYASTTTNSRFLLNSEYQRRYFETYCLPGARTATAGGIGPNPRSRIARLTREDFMGRPWTCMAPLGLTRIRSIKEDEEAIAALRRPFPDIVHDATFAARYDLTGPLESHVLAALAGYVEDVSPQEFNAICFAVEQSLQAWRRKWIFSVASKYPILIQSDDAAVPFVQGFAASLDTNVSMQLTLARMPLCRAVLSVSPNNDMIHDRTINAINGGSVAILEDSIASRAIFEHKRNALLFRYDDDSLYECLNIVSMERQVEFIFPDRPRSRARFPSPGRWNPRRSRAFMQQRRVVGKAKRAHRFPARVGTAPPGPASGGPDGRLRARLCRPYR